ncbi:protein-tyrosine phosphatase-like protein [Chaetomium strumarium]|uniref:protein-tyrosine-phosphatase n=1 Tax=Chaetomium strumarium TaxID=1170767 RepID=A0AAJ0GTY8_9PEZI|nr:protein-tyrosine phosphatase-like protein [Chaetomium strumarium]
MALNRINGADELYVGGIFGVNRAQFVLDHNISHILSVIKFSLAREDNAYRHVQHLSIDIDDMEDSDILVHLPKMVRFIDRGLRGTAAAPKESDPSSSSSSSSSSDNSAQPPSPATTSSSSSPQARQPGAVLVHCAMGKSRSVTAVIAYLLWKHPHRFGRSSSSSSSSSSTATTTTTTTAQHAVAQALAWVRQTRPVAEPNDGFMRQLELWCDMGCPADSDDAVERHPAYQRWVYKREVEDAARIGRAPDWIRFEDEEAAKEDEEGGDGGGDAGRKGERSGTELRCKKCRRVLATGPFIVPHQGGNDNDKNKNCPHFFVEALSWMRPILEEGALDGRLICPNAKCAASIGRYAWQGFKCSCGEWVAPAFSLQSSKVDRVVVAGRRPGGGGAGAIADRMAALGIRMPPGSVARSKENL